MAGHACAQILPCRPGPAALLFGIFRSHQRKIKESKCIPQADTFIKALLGLCSVLLWDYASATSFGAIKFAASICWKACLLRVDLPQDRSKVMPLHIVAPAAQKSSKHMITKDPSISRRRDRNACAEDQHHVLKTFAILLESGWAMQTGTEDTITQLED